MKNFARFLALVTVLLFFFFASTNSTQAQDLPEVQIPSTDFDCATVSDVTLAECQALVAFYASTNGASWTNHTNWLQTSTVGNWYGVTVSEGTSQGWFWQAICFQDHCPPSSPF